jgi:hypothetical protein
VEIPFKVQSHGVGTVTEPPSQDAQVKQQQQEKANGGHIDATDSPEELATGQ